MSLGKEQEEFTKDAIALMLKAMESGFSVRIGEVWRPIEMQEIYVKTGRSMTMKSNHLFKCAVDLVLLKDGKICGKEEIAPLGEFWESLDPKNRWGGNFKRLVDTPHFERNVNG